ncbi:MAG TPA: hypothetical protein VGR19_02560 [Allosphingosinicella sp.]|nr:hypothetical protein [Allosphingosinicella sp.]
MKTSSRAKAPTRARKSGAFASTLACALLAGTCLVAPAQAQTSEPPPPEPVASEPPPIRSAVDDNGVNLISGTFNFSVLEGAIGAGDGAVSFVRHWAGTGAWTDNWSGGLYVEETGAGMIWYAQFGTISDSFAQSGSAFTPVKADGASLTQTGTNTYRYTSRDGTTIDHRTKSPGGGELWGDACPQGNAEAFRACYIPVSVTKPNGTTFTLNWGFYDHCSFGTCTGHYRFQGVTSSTGYSFTVNYATDNPGSGSSPGEDWVRRTGVTFANAVVSCGTACPSMAYSQPDNTLTLTDQAGRQCTSPATLWAA